MSTFKANAVLLKNLLDEIICQGRREIRTHGGVKMYHPGIAVQRRCLA